MCRRSIPIFATAAGSSRSVSSPGPHTASAGAATWLPGAFGYLMPSARCTLQLDTARIGELADISASSRRAHVSRSSAAAQPAIGCRRPPPGYRDRHALGAFRNRPASHYHSQQKGGGAGMSVAEASHDRDPRRHFIPVHKSDIVRGLAAEAKLVAAGEGEKWRDFCRLLAAIFHYDYFADLERLKEAYYYFNPHHGGEPPTEASWAAAYQGLIATLRRVLSDANFVEVTKEEIEAAHRAHALLAVEVATPVEDYADIRFFRRGKHMDEVESAGWFRKTKRAIEVYDDVVLIAAAK